MKMLIGIAAVAGATWIFNLTNVDHKDAYDNWFYTHETVRTRLYFWPIWLAQNHLLNMTIEIIKDMEYKMLQAEKIIETYYGTQDFELGFIAATVQNRFRHMCEVYKLFSTTVTYLWENYTVYDYLDANHLVQSDYHEILVMKDLYSANVQKHKGLNKKKRVLERFFAQRAKMEADEKKSKLNAGGPGTPAPEGVVRPAPEGGKGRKLRMFEEKKYKETLRKKWHNKGKNTSVNHDMSMFGDGF